MFTFSKNKKPIKYEFYAPTIDDWYPNFVGNTVRVSVFPLGVTRINIGNIGLHDKVLMRVCIWGGDDDGMEKDWETTWQKAIDFANDIKQPISKEELKQLGFNHV